MVNKQILQSFISKYYLNGINQQVKWRISGKKLVVYAGEVGYVCKITLKEFDFEDAELGIFDTHKLNKLVNITFGDLIFETEKIKDLHTKLLISDQDYNLSYTLADTMVLPKSPYYEDPDNFEVELTLEKEHIQNLVKAKSALVDSNKMLIKTSNNEDGDPICDFIFGDQEGFSDKISYRMNGDISEIGIEIPFNSESFKDILHVNKDSEQTTLKINAEGMVKLNFENESIASEYYLLREE